jgi:hypothetical protein
LLQTDVEAVRVVIRGGERGERFCQLDVRIAEALALLFDCTLQQLTGLIPQPEPVVGLAHRHQQLRSQPRLGVQVRVDALDRGIEHFADRDRVAARGAGAGHSEHVAHELRHGC